MNANIAFGIFLGCMLGIVVCLSVNAAFQGHMDTRAVIQCIEITRHSVEECSAMVYNHWQALVDLQR